MGEKVMNGLRFKDIRNPIIREKVRATSKEIEKNTAFLVTDEFAQLKSLVYKLTCSMTLMMTRIAELEEILSDGFDTLEDDSIKAYMNVVNAEKRRMEDEKRHGKK